MSDKNVNKDSEKLFKSAKYKTKGISSEIPLCLEKLMWSMIEEMKVEKQDYFQVFILEKESENSRIVQKITHIQEQPEYEKTVVVPICENEVVEAKVYVIDDIDHCTMLLAEEY